MRLAKICFNSIVLLGLIPTMQIQGMAQLTLLKMAEDMIDNIKKLTAPIRLVGVEGGGLDNKYDIVETTIIIPNEKNAPVDKKKLAPTAKIRRAMIGSIGGTNSDIPVSLPDDFTMRVPVSLVNAGDALEGIPEIVTKVAGAVDPQAGAAAAAIGATVEITMQLATEQFNRLMGSLFDVQETTMTLLELIPEKYYRINAETNIFELTPQFKTDIVAYNRDYQTFAKVAAEYNKLLKDYNIRATQFNTKYPYGIPKKGVRAEEQAEYDSLLKMSNNQIKPAMKKVIGAMSAMQRYGMHRIAIMAIYTAPGTSCPDSVGPLYLYVYYFLGGKLKNVFKVPYCLKDKRGLARLIVHVSSDRINSRTGEFEQGGVKFIVVDKEDNPLTSCEDSQICFPIKVGTRKMLRWESAFYTWWDQIFTSSPKYGSSINAYMLPYDIYNTDKIKREIENSKHKEAIDKAEKLIDQGIEFLNTAKAQKELFEPKSTPSPRAKFGKSMVETALDEMAKEEKLTPKKEKPTTEEEVATQTEEEKPTTEPSTEKKVAVPEPQADV